MKTSATPMPPASSPALSWSVPSVGETVSASCCWKVSGRAPYFRTLARSWASFWVKLPVIWVWPLIVPWIAGAEITLPSSTNATLLLAALGVTVTLCWEVYWAQVAWPLLLKSSETVHCGLVEVGGTAEAPEMSVPSMIAGASRYFVAPFWSQAAMTSVGLSRLALAPALAEQVSFWNAATACWYCWGLTPGGGVGGIVVSVVAGTWAGAVAAGAVAAGAVAAGAEDAAPPDGAGAKPCGEAEPDGAADAFGDAEVLGDAVGLAEPEGAAVPDGAVAGVGAAAPLVISGRNRSWAVWPTVLAWSPLAPGTEMMIRSRPWVTTSASATPRPLTRRSMIWRAWSSAAELGGWLSVVLACSVTWVPPCRSRPSFGLAESPVKNTSAYRTTKMPASAPR